MFRCPGRGLTGFLRRHQKARLPVGLDTGWPQGPDFWKLMIMP
jgi:hypothetical protein